MILSQSNLDEFDNWYSEASTNGAVLLIDKDKAWTSFDVVAKVRGLTRIRKIGHAGTLDPLATGLLILCLGKFTKRINEFQDWNKRYTGVIKLGSTTKTDDSEGEEENITDVSGLKAEDIEIAIKSFEGIISQIPPKFSAKKVDGQRLYMLARKNIDVEIKPVDVTVYKIDIIDISLPFVSIDVLCAKGTYIRSLARDIGAKLGVGGHLSALRRTDIGEFSVNDALTVKTFNEIFSKLEQTNSSI
jgi:tRNA pseudouridine55 synthase